MKNIKGIIAVLALALLACIPLKLAQTIGRYLGRKMYQQGQNNKFYSITKANIDLCFNELEDGAKDNLIKASLEQTGKSIAEMGMSWLWPVNKTLKKIVQVNDEAIITQGIAAGKGVILIAPHLGNWEILNLYLSNRYPFTAMYKPPKQKQLDNLIKKMRARLGTDMAPANVQGVRKVMKALKRGEMVGILPDQEPEIEGGVFCDFFGIPALTMKLLPQLAAQTGAKVVCGYAKRLDQAQGFEIYFKEVDPQIRDKNILISASAMNRAIESCVRDIPEQYQWEYKRFNTRPDKVPAVY